MQFGSKNVNHTYTRVKKLALPRHAAFAHTRESTTIGDGCQRESARVFEQTIDTQWHGQNVRVAFAGVTNQHPVLLCHGFGATTEHWRKVVPEIVKAGYYVIAIDLIGFGFSSKPAERSFYCVHSWAQQVLWVLSAHSNGKATAIVGNSIGSLIALEAARQDGAEAVHGICLLNCAGGINSKALAFADWRTALLYPLLKLVDLALTQVGVAQALLQRVRSEEVVKSLLRSVYYDQSAVDQELIDFIREPAFTKGAEYSLRNVLTNPPGPTPFEIYKGLNSSKQHILTLWGEDDIIAPVSGPVAQWFSSLPNKNAGPRAQFVQMQQSNHCPHDDNYESVIAYLLEWLQYLPSCDGDVTLHPSE